MIEVEPLNRGVPTKGRRMNSKVMALCVFIVFAAGCSYGSEKLKTLLTDPDYSQYRERLDSLERSRLHGEISYPQYLEKKQQLDEDYARIIQEREQKIHGR